LSPDWQLLAVYQDQLNQLHSQLGDTRYVPRLLSNLNAAQHGLASPRHDPAVNHKWLLQL
jgi:hypothetical protein